MVNNGGDMKPFVRMVGTETYGRGCFKLMILFLNWLPVWVEGKRETEPHF